MTDEADCGCLRQNVGKVVWVFKTVVFQRVKNICDPEKDFGMPAAEPV